jgi:uncharacterized membrane protein YhaH (DUF805 family)
MGIGDVLRPAGNMFSNSAVKLAKYWWVFLIFLGIGIAVAVIFFIKMIRQKKAQWTHTFEIKRVLKNGLLSDPITHKARRFPLIKNAEVFELETSLLGSFLIPEPGRYSGVNKYSLILDDNNRIWRNEGEYFNPVDGSINVSARHAEIDLQHSTLKADWQNINKMTKRIDWMQIAKYAMMTVLILAVMIVAIVAIGEWGDAKIAEAEGDKAFAGAMENLNSALETSLEAKNTDVLILDKLNQLYGTKNIAGTIQDVKNQTA